SLRPALKYADLRVFCQRGAGINPAERMASLAIDPLNLIRVMPAEGRYEAYFLPCLLALARGKGKNESESRQPVEQLIRIIKIHYGSESCSSKKPNIGHRQNWCILSSRGRRNDPLQRFVWLHTPPPTRRDYRRTCLLSRSSSSVFAQSQLLVHSNWLGDW